jgi:hypothetical protein
VSRTPCQIPGFMRFTISLDGPIFRFARHFWRLFKRHVDCAFLPCMKVKELSPRLSHQGENRRVFIRVEFSCPFCTFFSLWHILLKDSVMPFVAGGALLISSIRREHCLWIVLQYLNACWSSKILFAPSSTAVLLSWFIVFAPHAVRSDKLAIFRFFCCLPLPRTRKRVWPSLCLEYLPVHLRKVSWIILHLAIVVCLEVLLLVFKALYFVLSDEGLFFSVK